MRYEFDTDVAKELTILQLTQEETILCEIFEHIRLLRNRKEQDAYEEAKGRSEVAKKREKDKTGWVKKRVAERRVEGL